MRSGLKKKVFMFFVLCVISIAGVACAARGGLTNGLLSGTNDSLDLNAEVGVSYYDDEGITLSGNSVTLTGETTLATAGRIGLSSLPYDQLFATNLAYGGIHALASQTLTIGNITNNAGILRFLGESTASGTAGGTLALNGQDKRQAAAGVKMGTYIQSGVLRIESAGALSSELILGNTGDTSAVALVASTDVTLPGKVAVNAKSSATLAAESGQTLTTNSFGTASTVDSFSIGSERYTGTVALRNYSLGTTGDKPEIYVKGGTLRLDEPPHSSGNRALIDIAGNGTLAFRKGATDFSNMIIRPQSSSSKLRFSLDGASLSESKPAGNNASGALAVVRNIRNTAGFTIELEGIEASSMQEGKTYWAKLLHSNTPLSNAGNLKVLTPSGFTAKLSYLDSSAQTILLEISRREDDSENGIQLSAVPSGKTIQVSATVKNTEGRLVSGINVSFDIASDGLSHDVRVVQTNADGVASFTSDTLPDGQYVVVASAWGYKSVSVAVTIGLSSGGSSPDDYTVSLKSSVSNPGNILVSLRRANGMALTPGELYSVYYSFRDAGGSRNANVSDNTIFDVTYGYYEDGALVFPIDLGNLIARDGGKYTLAAGRMYKLYIGFNDRAVFRYTLSKTLVDQYGIIDISYIKTSVGKVDHQSLWAEAEVTGRQVSGIDVTFTVVDRNGNAVNLSEDSNPKTARTNANGIARVSFSGLPTATYYIRTSAGGFNADASSPINLGDGEGGGCDAGAGSVLLLLFLTLFAWKTVRKG